MKNQTDPTPGAPERSLETRLEAIEASLERLETRLAAADSLAAQFPDVFATLVDTFDQSMARMVARGIDPVEVGRNTSEALQHLVQTLQSEEFRTLMNSGVLDPVAVRIIADAGRALAEAHNEVCESTGVFQLLRSFKDPNIQRAMNFAMRFGRRFGQMLTPRLPAGS